MAAQGELVVVARGRERVCLRSVGTQTEMMAVATVVNLDDHAPDEVTDKAAARMGEALTSSSCSIMEAETTLLKPASRSTAAFEVKSASRNTAAFEGVVFECGLVLLLALLWVGFQYADRLEL